MARDGGVTREEHDYVLRRDRICFLYRLDRAHVCRDTWGQAHAPDRLDLLTVDHVHLHAGGTKGKRAKGDRRHLVAMCALGNVAVPSRAIREAEREYLQQVET